MAREALSLMDIGGEARLDHAESLEQVVKGREKICPYHANTLKSITILGSILRKQTKQKLLVGSMKSCGWIRGSIWT